MALALRMCLAIPLQELNAYLKASARYSTASQRHRRMPCTLTEQHLETARTRMRAAYSDHLDALATAGMPLPRSAR